MHSINQKKLTIETIEALEVVGIGNTAVLYKWTDDKILKFFKPRYTLEDINYEYYLTQKINDYAFAKPRVYNRIDIGERHGLVYDYIEGISLTEWMLTHQKIEEGVTMMAQTFKTITSNDGSDFPSYKDYLKMQITHANQHFEFDLEKALAKVEALPKGYALCHGDYHPENLMMSGDTLYVIDFMNLCCGHPLYDIARTVYLVGMTPVPDEEPNQALLVKAKRDFCRLYLSALEVAEKDIQPYLELIELARMGENPEEFAHSLGPAL